jgi:hypothetical protein
MYTYPLTGVYFIGVIANTVPCFFNYYFICSLLQLLRAIIPFLLKNLLTA